MIGCVNAKCLTSSRHFLYFIFIKLDERATIFNFSMLGPATYFYKMAATVGRCCGEVGIKFLKQELLCFFRAHHEIIGWENWIV